VNSPGAALRSEYESINVEATRRLADLASDRGARIVFASTINVYGATHGAAPRTESDPLNPDSIYAETKVRAEQIVRDAGGLVLRLAAVYGPGMKGNYPKLMRLLDRTRVLPGDGRNRRTLVHVDDAAAAVIAALALSGAGTYNVTDARVHTFDEIVRSMQTAIGKNPGVRYIPSKPINAILALPAAVLRVAGKATDPRSMVNKLIEDIAISGDRFIAESSYRPRVTDLAGAWTSHPA
jgi:UDP-glucose 4-epimerase